MKKILPLLAGLALCFAFVVVALPVSAQSTTAGCKAGYTYDIYTGARCVFVEQTPGTVTTPGFPNTGSMPLAPILVPSILLLGLIGAAAYSLRHVNRYQ